MFPLPVIVVNFKSYREASGERGLELARIAQEVSEESGVTIAVAPQMVDLALVVREVKIPVFAQHIDTVKTGSYTGSTTLNAVKEAGAVGSLLNHAEKRIKASEIDEIITEMNREEMVSILCTNNYAVSKALSLLSPTFIAIEPPELIGGDVSVTTAKPEIITRVVKSVEKLAPEVGVLTGAGVKTSKDVRRALELGCDGVLLASGVVKSDNPRKTLEDLASGVD
ncbi:MAG: triose-phosphate isomerase [Thermoplasmata archaeon]|nr:triose-phosphate isomerase [Thermoplasmata archaeon]